MEYTLNCMSVNSLLLGNLRAIIIKLNVRCRNKQIGFSIVVYCLAWGIPQNSVMVEGQ